MGRKGPGGRYTWPLPWAQIPSRPGLRPQGLCAIRCVGSYTSVPPPRSRLALRRTEAAEGASMKRTQILLPDDLHRKLLKHAKAHKTSMGDLVRRAVERAYFARLEELALVAYRNGLISLGKLAEISGTNPARALELLREKGIAPLLGPESAEEARQDAAVTARAR